MMKLFEFFIFVAKVSIVKVAILRKNRKSICDSKEDCKETLL